MSAPGGVGGRAPDHGRSNCRTDSVDCPFRGSSDREERGGVLDDGDRNHADHTIVFPEDGERTEPGGCNDYIASGPHPPAGGPHGVAGAILHPHGGRPRDEPSEARILVQMQSLPEVVGRCPPAGPDAQHEHAGLHAGKGNPLLTAEHPLEAIPRNYREACRGRNRPRPPQDCGRVPQNRGGGFHCQPLRSSAKNNCIVSKQAKSSWKHLKVCTREQDLSNAQAKHLLSGHAQIDQVSTATTFHAHCKTQDCATVAAQLLN